MSKAACDAWPSTKNKVSHNNRHRNQLHQLMKVAIVKYNGGNIRSVVNSFQQLGVELVVTDNAEALMTADRVIFPGQGEASSAMAHLKENKLDLVIRNLPQPVLGICIGQQLMCRHSEEGDTDCIGIFPVDVKRFRPTSHEFKVPAIGWNQIENATSPLFHGFKEGEFVYYVHSYYVPICKYTIATSDYIQNYSAALHKDNFYATQFHPEKSGEIGKRILKNFLDL